MTKKDVSRKEFLRLGTALGLGSAVVPIAAACDGPEPAQRSGGATTARDDSGSTEQDTTVETTRAEESTETARVEDSAEKKVKIIAKEAEVAPGEALPFQTSGQPAVLVHLQSGDFVAYSAVCTHQQCTVAYQQQSGILACPCHGSAFDPANGAAVVNGPATRPLPEVPVEVRDGEVVRS